MKKARKTFLAIAGAALAVTAINAVTSNPSAAEDPDKEAVRKIVKEYLNEHPELVIQALETYQANQEEFEKRRFKETFESAKPDLIAEGLPYIGNPNGDVVIVEFFDYNCGYCKRALKDIQTLIKNDDNIKVIFHEMPILSGASNDAARYALAANMQDKYFEYHQAIMNMAGAKTRNNLESEAEKLGLDLAKLREDANSRAVRQQIEQSLSLSRKLGIRGTPAFIIGDILAPGYMPWQDIHNIVKQVRDENKG